MKITGKLTPELITERHKQFPEGTEQLIETYAFQEYQKAISDLLKFGKIAEVENTDVAMIVISKSDLKEWQDLKASHWYLNKHKRPLLNIFY